jgi:uncharacterized RDD family membrane protein YckC/cytoskeletal protein CcmA (bactofilin family)
LEHCDDQIMNTIIMLRRLSFLFILLGASAIVAHAEQPAPASAPATLSAPAPVAAEADDEFPESPATEHQSKRRAHHHSSGSGNDVVSIGHNSHLGAGETADSVVSIFGSSTSEGEADDVVSVLGNTRVTGPVHGNAVAVLGNLYVDSKVDGDAVAVLGSVQLGPHAQIEGDVTAALGRVHHAPESIIRGNVNDVFVGDFGDMDGLHTWLRRCLFEGRPLAFVSGIEWAWGIAFVFLILYVFLALVFRSGISQCINTLETQPGHSALAALLTMLLAPVLLVLLCITVIGIAAVPFVVITLFCVSLFGKAVVLAWMGHRVVGHRSGSGSHPAVAVLVGGAIALLLYCIPVVGLLTYKLLGFFGVGAVVYTLLMGQRARQAARAERVNGDRAYRGAAQAAAADAGAAVAAAAVAGAGEAAPGAAGAQAAAAPAASTGNAPGTAQPEPPPQVLAALPRAGFWLRIGALLIDVLLIGLLTHLGPFHHHSNLHLLVLAVYGACMWKLRGSTVGGIVCDLRVVRVDGRPIEWDTAIVRALGCFLSLAVCGLGFIWIAFDQNHQAWHDKIAGTVVVRVPKGRPLV